MAVTDQLERLTAALRDHPHFQALLEKNDQPD
jgi:hypothetical protein